MYSSTYSTQGNLALKAPAHRHAHFVVIDGSSSSQSAHTSGSVVTSHASAAASVAPVVQTAVAPQQSAVARARVLPRHEQTPTQKLAGRMLACVAVAALIVSFIVVGFNALSAVASTTFANEVVASQEVRVQAGDSLWSLAAEYPLEGYSTQETADIIYEINNLSQSMLTPGMMLTIPTELA